jgi:acetamidase/formamidase
VASNDAFSVSDKSVAPKLDLTSQSPDPARFTSKVPRPGDTLEVHIDSIELNRDWGWGASIPTSGCLRRVQTAMVTPPHPTVCSFGVSTRAAEMRPWTCRTAGSAKSKVPIRLFFGTIGTAPAGKECISSLVQGRGANAGLQRGRHLESPCISRCSNGGVIHAGRWALRQGDGEIDGAAIETPFTVKFTVNLIRARKSTGRASQRQ